MNGLPFGVKRALITGGGSGIGFGLAQALVERGAAVALIGTYQAKLDGAVAELKRAGGKAVARRLDVIDRADWRDAVEAVEQKFDRINISLLNAGAQDGRRRVEEVSLQEWDWVWSVNVDGVFTGLCACLPATRDLRTSSYGLAS